MSTEQQAAAKESDSVLSKALDSMIPGFNPLDANRASSPADVTPEEAAHIKAEDERRLAEAEAERIAAEAEANKGKAPETTTTGDEIEIEESELANSFAGLLVDQFDLELNDGFEIKTLDDVKSLISEIVEANSKPQFASEEVQKINEIVANGGSPVDYLNSLKQVIGWDTFSIENEDNQKTVIREYYKAKGLADSKIEKIITSLVIDEELAKEAEEILPELKADAKAKADQVKLNSEAHARQVREQAEQFYKSSEESVKGMKEFRGAAITDTDRQKAINYIFGVDKATGKTYEQLDYEKDPIQYRLEMALLRTKSDLKDSLERKATTDATKRFKTKLRVTTAKDAKRSSGGDDSLDMKPADLISKYVS